MRKQLYVIAYDIQDNKSRKQVADLLEAEGGTRRNLSVFEAMLTTATCKRTLLQIKTHLDAQTDSLLCYKICRTCYTYTQYYPNEASEPIWKDITVV